MPARISHGGEKAAEAGRAAVSGFFPGLHRHNQHKCAVELVSAHFAADLDGLDGIGVPQISSALGYNGPAAVGELQTRQGPAGRRSGLGRADWQ